MCELPSIIEHSRIVDIFFEGIMKRGNMFNNIYDIYIFFFHLNNCFFLVFCYQLCRRVLLHLMLYYLLQYFSIMC